MLRGIAGVGTFICLAAGFRPESSDVALSVKTSATGNLEVADRSMDWAPSPAPQAVENEVAKPVPGAERTNVCDRLKAVSSGKLQLKDALGKWEGKTLKLTAVNAETAHNSVKKKMEGNKTTFHGYDVEVLKYIASKAGFSFRIVEHEQEKGMTRQQWLESTTQSYDINLGHWAIDWENEANGFTQIFGFVDASLYVATTREATTAAGLSVFTLLQPYDWKVWSVWLAISITTFIVYHYLEGSREPDPDKQQDEDKATVYGAAYTAVMQMYTVGTLSPATHGGRIISVSWSLLSLVFLAGYGANLVTCLVANRLENTEWQNLDDVTNAGARICVRRNDDGEKYMKENNPDYTKVVPTDNIWESMKKGDCEAVITWKNQYEIARSKQEYNPDCKLDKVGQSLNRNWGGWYSYEDHDTKCTALIKDVFRMMFIQMRHDGVEDKLWERHLLKPERTRKKSCDHEADTSNDSISLPLTAMGGIFTVHCIALIAALGLKFMAPPATPAS